MAYTPSGNKSNAGKTNMGPLVVDSNRIGMTGVLGNNFQTRDATTSPVGSPLTMTGSPQTLTVPNNAAQITITTYTASVNVSEDSTLSVYDTIPIGTSRKYDVARQQFVYLSGTSPDLVTFVFNLV